MSLLAVKGLTRHFAGLTALKDVSFDLAPGSMTALIGPNGAGKTTCFNLIAGAMPPSAGTVTFDGGDVTGLAPERACALGIARTFQIVRPLSGLSVLDNVTVAALVREPTIAAARAQAARVLARVGLEHKADAPAAGLTLPERKMLELAKALATRPRLLMLDEVMAGLRPAEAMKVAAVIGELNAGGLTVLLIEHVMRVVMAIARTVIVLHHGEKIAEGAPGEIASDPRVIECYLGSLGRRK
jgi:branched-chain amino acid transport system ATP-binding protein